MENKLKRFKEILALLRKYEHALGIMYFDFETIVPNGARDDEGDILDFFSNEHFKLSHSDEIKGLIQDLYQNKDKISDPLDVKLVEIWYENYAKTKNITPELDLKMSNIYSRAYSNWLKAKEAKDYSLFKDSFKEVIDIQRVAVNLRENKLEKYYDNLLDDCEKGMLQEDLDPFFNELKVGLIELINKIKNSKHVIRRDFLNRNVPIYKQEAFSKYLLELNGYDFNRGALTTTEHPFTSDIAKNDARVTTHYHEDMVLSNIFSVIHEGGHAIFMQNERDEDYDHFINDEITNGMHESVSRFYENIVGRSKEYIHLIYPKFIETFDEFKDISERELYEAVNIVKPSLIRTEADEVTYGLHIIIRYEMEKMICNNEINVNDIPAMWNKLYKDYLGVGVPNDSLGVLQDVHWSSGFGYFPSYAIGNCYNAMYIKRMEKEIPFRSLLEKGDFTTINKWMKENVFIHANVLTPKEWIKELTGESLSPKAFLKYLNNKYKDIYQF
ncbi:MAG: carboxypeptidase M32 [Bacilli bacterium]|nr:carboxypeptidase M32 [Bacilli bacterium]